MEPLRIERRCNQHCFFCGADPEQKDSFVTDLDAIKARIASTTPDDLIEISGGEPTLSPLLPKVLLAAKQLRRRTILQTNATRCSDRRFATLLVKTGLTDAFVSLHAPEARLADALTRSKGTFALSVAGIKNLLSEKVRVSLNMVVCKGNRKHLVKMARFVASEFETQAPLVFSFINPFHNAWRYPEIIPPISSIVPEFHAALLEGERLGLTVRIPDICGIPQCFLVGYERFCDKFHSVMEKRPYTPCKDKIKGDVCPSCAWYEMCDGLWKRYAERYGFGELKPVKDLPEGLMSSGSYENRPERARDTALLIGQNCQNHCLFCSEGGGDALRHVMSLKEADALLSATKPEWVFLSGGEPTSCPDLQSYIRLARNHGATRITLVTNGGKLSDPQFCSRIVEWGVDEIRISIHGPDAETHDALTRRPGSFADIRKAMENLKPLKNGRSLRLIALTVLNRMNLESLPHLVETLDAFGFDKIGLGMVEPRGNAERFWREVIPRYVEVASRIEELYSYLKNRKGLDLDLFIDSLPPCLFNHQNLPLGERSVIQTLDRNGKLVTMGENRGKSFGPPCEACTLRNRCEGVFTGYAQRYGWSEFGLSRD